MAERYTNEFKDSLRVAVNDSNDVTLDLVMLSVDFPAELDGGNWRLRCGDEIMLVTAVDLQAANPVLTVTRAVEGEIAAHGVGSKVIHVLTSGSLEVIINEVLATHTADATDAHDASAISVVPAGNIAASTVQAAIDELDSEKSDIAHDHDLDYDAIGSAATAEINAENYTDGLVAVLQAAIDDLEARVTALEGP